MPLKSLNIAFAIVRKKPSKQFDFRLILELESLDKSIISPVDSQVESGLIFLNSVFFDRYDLGSKAFTYFHEMWHCIGQAETSGVKPDVMIYDDLDNVNKKLVSELGTNIAEVAYSLNTMDLKTYFDYVFSNDFNPDFIPVKRDSKGLLTFNDSELDHFDKDYTDGDDMKKLDSVWEKLAEDRDDYVKGGKEIREKGVSRELIEKILHLNMLLKDENFFKYFYSKKEIMPDAFAGATLGYSYDQIAKVRFKLYETIGIWKELEDDYGENTVKFLKVYLKSIYTKTLKETMPEVLPYVEKLGKKLGFLDQIKMNIKNFINKNR